MENQSELKILISKLVKVLGGVERIPKNGYNDFHRYAYATEADVSDHTRKLLSDNNIFMMSSIEEVINRDITTKSGKAETIVRVKIKVTFLCGETGESLSFHTWGDGQDAGDKGIYKAITGAIKYALMKNFLIPTGDDPENDNQPKNDKNISSQSNKATYPKQTVKQSPKSQTTQPKPTAGREEILTAQGMVENVESKKGEKDGKPWERFTIQLDCGRYQTFDKKIVDAALVVQADGMPFEIKYTYHEKFGNTIKEACVANIGDTPF